MDCIVHIGFYKTGTSSLQAVLRANEARLGADVALITMKSAALQRVRRACNRFERRRDPGAGQAISTAVQRMLRPYAEQGKARVIVSTEALCGPIPTPRRKGPVFSAAPDTLTWVKRGCAPHATRFVAYVRGEVDWRSSLYRHLVRTRGLGLREAAFNALPDFADFRFDALCGAIRDTIGDLTIYRMEADFSKPVGPGNQLLNDLGYDDAELAGWARVAPQNVGLGRAAMAVMSRDWALRLPEILRRILARFLAWRLPEKAGGA